jgi:effector-binding domain-containing protein
MIGTPEITSTEPGPTARIRLRIPKHDLRNVMGPARKELLEVVIGQGIGPAGPVFSHHFWLEREVWDFELGVSVHRPVTGEGRVEPGEIPAMRIARTVYEGPYDGLADAWREFDTWLSSNGHDFAVDFWAFYLTGPESGRNPSEWEIELQRPLLAWR